MRSSRSSLLLAALATALIEGCGEGGAPAESPHGALAPRPGAPPGYAEDEHAWGAYHSKRLLLSLKLPEGRVWRIDDHSGPELRASHPGTRSEVIVSRWSEGELVGRKQCEARARERGFVPRKDLRTLESTVTVGPEAFDTRQWVALEVKGSGALVGHLFAFGGNIRQCLLFHLSTEVDGVVDELVLSQRLAMAKTRILDRLALDPPRIGEDIEVGREKPAPPPKK